MVDFINEGDRHTTEQLSTITPIDGDVLMDTTKKVLVIGDGETKGGNAMLKEDEYYNLGMTKDETTTTIKYPESSNWDDLRFPAQGINPPGAENDPDVDTTDGTLLFSASRTEVIAGVAQMPHSWLEGSIVVPHIHWQPTNTDTGNVYWRFEYDIANVNGTFSGSYTAINILDAGSGDVNGHLLADFGDLAMPGYTLSSIIKWRISRIGGDATDTYTADAKLLEFDIHYQIDSVGSGEEYTK